MFCLLGLGIWIENEPRIREGREGRRGRRKYKGRVLLKSLEEGSLLLQNWLLKIFITNCNYYDDTPKNTESSFNYTAFGKWRSAQSC
jgi:hypothetical protein